MILSTCLTLTSFSQTDTDSTKKCFPVKIVKSIIKDLISGDECKEELRLTEQQLKETEKKVEVKDSVIYKMEEKEKNYLTLLIDERTKYGVLEDHTKKLETNLKLRKLETKFTRALSGGAILVLTTLLILK